MIYRGLLSRDKVQRFWTSMVTLILERVSRKMLKKRAFIKDEDIQTYSQMDDPQIDLDDLSDDTKLRI